MGFIAYWNFEINLSISSDQSAPAYGVIVLSVRQPMVTNWTDKIDCRFDSHERHTSSLVTSKRMVICQNQLTVMCTTHDERILISIRCQKEYVEIISCIMIHNWTKIYHVEFKRYLYLYFH